MVGLWTSDWFDTIYYYYFNIRNLLFNRAPIGSIDVHGRTCFHRAALHNQWKELIFSLQCMTEIYDSTKCKEIIDQKDYYGTKAITYAIRHNNLPFVKRLVASGGTTGQEELFEAVDAPTPENFLMVLYFLTVRKIPFNCYNKLGDTPLSCAAQNGDKTLVDYLLKMGAEVNSASKDGLLPLTNAVIQAAESDYFGDEHDGVVCYNVFDLLLKWGADVNKSNDAGDTPLINCSKYDYIEAVHKLLSVNADPNRVNNNGMSALAFAAERGCFDNIRRLIEKGAIVNPSDGVLPLVCAVQNNKFEIVKYLVANGANVNRVDNKGNSPLLAAVKTENYKMIEWLLDNGACFSIHSVFLESVRIGNLKIIEMLIEKGAKVNLQYKNGSTPLLRAIESKRVDVIETLLAHGANINLEGNIEWSTILPFRRLLETDLTGTNFNNIVKTFIDRGADISVTRNDNFSWLAKYVQLDDYKMVQYLVSKGANINQTDDPKKAPLAIAAKNSNYEIFDYLVNSGGNIELVIRELDKAASSNDSFAVFFEELKKKRGKTAQITEEGYFLVQATELLQ